ncbi:MAG: hypothetical protein JWO06_3668 [Bacteroidota bacterium]|nr:hypothetical protein [Bacteroidota bacterium]
MRGKLFICATCLLFIASCSGQQTHNPLVSNDPTKTTGKPVVGAARLDQLIPLIKGKNIALLVNQTAVLGSTHLIDTLLSSGIKIKKIFAPEHGFRGNADAGEHVNDSMDLKTVIAVVSLYGKKSKPSKEDLEGIDIVIFDIQDVGARFYTFISSLHYLMEACAENNKELIVLDRPNPNGWYVDGPVLKKEFQSFVGVDPVPVVHGLTVGEYSQMANGEKWLRNGLQCNLKVITCQNYEHKMKTELSVKPSPNLPNALAVMLYPSICFFEGTNVSVGRGTDSPFQIIGSPKTKFDGAYEFIPQSKPGAKNPPFVNEKCYGFNLSNPKNRHNSGQFNFQYVIDMYKLYSDKSNFFLKTGFFDKLCGTDEIRKLVEEGKDEKEIRASYQKELDAYKLKRKKYLLYKDFE